MYVDKAEALIEKYAHLTTSLPVRNLAWDKAIACLPSPDEQYIVMEVLDGGTPPRLLTYDFGTYVNHRPLSTTVRSLEELPSALKMILQNATEST